MNVLIALAWPIHVHHQAANAWFEKQREAGFRTCPMTQSGFVRLSSNRAFTDQAASTQEALQMLRTITELPDHEFWPDDINLTSKDYAWIDPRGHRQIRDAYLISLAAKHSGIVATLDHGLASLSPSPDLVEIVRA